jgi:hypothetical protein
MGRGMEFPLGTLLHNHTLCPRARYQKSLIEGTDSRPTGCESALVSCASWVAPLASARVGGAKSTGGHAVVRFTSRVDKSDLLKNLFLLSRILPPVVLSRIARQGIGSWKSSQRCKQGDRSSSFHRNLGYLASAGSRSRSEMCRIRHIPAGSEQPQRNMGCIQLADSFENCDPYLERGGCQARSGPALWA